MKTKHLAELTIGDKILHRDKDEILTITDILNDSDESSRNNRKYFYFSEIGSNVYDKAMKYMFENNDKGFLLFNEEA